MVTTIAAEIIMKMSIKIISAIYIESKRVYYFFRLYARDPHIHKEINKSKFFI